MNVVVDVVVLNHKTGEFETLFTGITLDVIEFSNKRLNEAFVTQHPKLFAKIPRFTLNGFTFVYAFECKVRR